METNLRAHLLRRRQEEVYWAERLAAELDFAEGLLALHPEKAAEWKALLGAAQAAAAGAGSTREACERAEFALQPLAPAAKACRILCVGHGHIDMNWMWSWPETVQITNDTLSTVLCLMEEFPGFCFSQSQASVYRILELYNPALLARIAERVREGRWEVTASHWVEGDKNIAGGESLCRHLLYTRRYIQRLFGLSPEEVPIDWSPDTFGHAATVPTYLVRGGVRYLYLHRPGIHTEEKHDLFWWEGPDGARVLVRNDMRLGYNGTVSPWIGKVMRDYFLRTGLSECMYVFGVGDHGGGPTRRDLERALDMAAWPVFPAVEFGTARAFFESVSARPDLPVFRGELNTEFTGCYTSQSLIKKANRFSEARLADAEFAASFAALAAGGSYPAARLEEAWRDTLFGHFHDILPGSGVHDTRSYMHGKYQEIMATTSMAEALALRALAAKVDTRSVAGASAVPPPAPLSHARSGFAGGAGMWSGDGNLSPSEQHHRQGDRPFLVFNPAAVERNEVVEAILWDQAPPEPFVPLKEVSFVALAPDGGSVPAQKTGEGQEWGHHFVKLSFPVRVPAAGYAVYVLREVDNAEAGPSDSGDAHLFEKKHHCSYVASEKRPLGLENERLRVELDPVTGGIRRLVDRASGLALIDEPVEARTLEFGYELPRGMTAWCLEHMREAGAPRVKQIRSPLAGPHRAAIEVDLAFGHDSAFTLAYELRRDDPNLYLTLKGRWGERGSAEAGIPALRARFPLALSEARARYEIPFGAIDRTLCRGEEVPALEWASVAGRCGSAPFGALLLNDSKHGHALDGSCLTLSLIRASYDPDPLPEIGEHVIRLALSPAGGALPVEEATARARAFNHPLRLAGAPVQEGALPATGQGFRLEGKGIVLSGCKRAEDGKSLILRFYECEGRAASGALSVDETLWGRVLSAEETDLLERSVPKSSARLDGGTVRFSLPARGIVTLRLGLERAAALG